MERARARIRGCLGRGRSLSSRGGGGMRRERRVVLLESIAVARNGQKGNATCDIGLKMPLGNDAFGRHYRLVSL